MFYHDNVPLYTAKLGHAQSPDLNNTEHFWDELEQGRNPGPPHPASVPELTNALLAESTQHLVQNFTRTLKVIMMA